MTSRLEQEMKAMRDAMQPMDRLIMERLSQLRRRLDTRIAWGTVADFKAEAELWGRILRENELMGRDDWEKAINKAFDAFLRESPYFPELSDILAKLPGRPLPRAAGTVINFAEYRENISFQNRLRAHRMGGEEK